MDNKKVIIKDSFQLEFDFEVVKNSITSNSIVKPIKHSSVVKVICLSRKINEIQVDEEKKIIEYILTNSKRF